MLLINLLDIFTYVHQPLPLVVANGVRALIMLLLLALLPAGRYLGPGLGHTCRWMFMVIALLAAFEAARSIGSIYGSHIVSSAIIACVALTFVVDFSNYKYKWVTARRARRFCVASFIAVLLAHSILKPTPLDVGYLSVHAIEAMSMWLNPYTVDIDMFDYTASKTNEKEFRGYKYSPLCPIIYLPGVVAFGDNGILVANGLILVLAAFTVSALCRRISADKGMWAALLLLASPVVSYNAIVAQGNDLVAALPLCVAFLVWDRRAGLAGLLLGASASIKIIPAPIAMALLLPLELAAARRFVTGIALGLIPCMGFAALDPPAFFNNVILFQVLRKSSPNSFLFGVSSDVIWFLRIAFVAAFLGTAGAAVTRNWSIGCRMLAYVVLTIILLLSAPSNFVNNYWLWWIPIFIPLIAADGSCVPLPRWPLSAGFRRFRTALS